MQGEVTVADAASSRYRGMISTRRSVSEEERIVVSLFTVIVDIVQSLKSVHMIN